MIHIAQGCRVTGDLVTGDEVRLDGRLEGSISAMRLEIGPDGYLVGTIHVDELVVDGQVLGNIRARKVTVAASALVEGEITHVLLALDEGAILLGDCIRVRAIDVAPGVAALRAEAAAEAQSLTTLEKLSREAPGSARVRVVRRGTGASGNWPTL